MLAATIDASVMAIVDRSAPFKRVCGHRTDMECECVPPCRPGVWKRAERKKGAAAAARHLRSVGRSASPSAIGLAHQP